MPTRSGGRYVMRDGKPVLDHRSGDPKAAPSSTIPATATNKPLATQPPVEDASDEDQEKSPARRPRN